MSDAYSHEDGARVRASLPVLADFPMVSLEKLRFADTDRYGHITNTVFAVCCQNARMELLCDPEKVPLERNTQFVIAKLTLEFRAEMHWPGMVRIGTRIARIGRTSLTLLQGLFMDDRCVAIAQSVVALMDTTTRRATLIPPRTAEALRTLALGKGTRGCGSQDHHGAAAESPWPALLQR